MKQDTLDAPGSQFPSYKKQRGTLNASTKGKSTDRATRRSSHYTAHLQGPEKCRSYKALRKKALDLEPNCKLTHHSGVRNSKDLVRDANILCHPITFPGKHYGKWIQKRRPQNLKRKRKKQNKTETQSYEAQPALMKYPKIQCVFS